MRVRPIVALAALVTLAGAVFVVLITEVAVAFSCEEGESCDALSDPMAMRAMAWITFAGVVATSALVLLRIRWATAASLALTGMSFVIWLSLFVYVVEGSL